MKIDVSKIKVRNRFRKDMGDLEALAESISKLGLLQPIGVVPKGPTGHVELVFGERRFRACRDILGWTEIEIRPLDIGDLLEKEQDENEVRKDFTISERTAIAQAIAAEIGNRQGHRTDLDNPQNIAELEKSEHVQNIAQVEPGMKTRDIAAKKAGFGNHETYRQASAVVENAEPETIEAMDNNVISISTAHKLSKQPPDVQKRAVVDRTFMDRSMKKADAEIEATMTDGRRRQKIVNAFREIRDNKITPAAFMHGVLPAHLDDVQSAAPRVREFLDLIEGAQNEEQKNG